MKGMIVTCSGIVVLWVIGMWAAFTGHDRLAVIASGPLLLLWMMTVMGYVIFLHSRKRWPGLRWDERAWKILTFKR